MSSAESSLSADFAGLPGYHILSNTSDWRNSPIIRRADGSFVVAHAGYPAYHVPNNEEFASFWAQIAAYAQEHLDQVIDEPAPAGPTEDELLARAKTIKTAEFDAVDMRHRDELMELTADILATSIRPDPVSVEELSRVSGKQERFFNIRQVRADNRQRREAMLAATTVVAVEAIIPATLNTPEISGAAQGYTI